MVPDELVARACPRRRDSPHCRGRVRLFGRAERLRKIHVTEYCCRAGPCRSWQRPGRRQTDRRTRAHRLMMFQESALFPWLTVLGNVLFGLKLSNSLSAPERLEKAEYFLELVGLKRFMHSNVHELSGGMKQRVALARALAPNPSVLLMDEPFGALDALTREQLYGDIQRIWSQHRKTSVFVTHNVREAVCLGDRVIWFSPHPGRIREEFAIPLPRPRDINSVELARYATEITRVLKGYVQPEVAG